MFDAAAVVLDLDIGNRVRPAFRPDQQTVTLGVVAAVLGLGVHGHETTIGVLGLARADPLGDDARFGVLAQMDHLGAGVGLLHVVGDGDRVELTLTVIPTQDAGRVFPRHRRAGFDLCPHDLGAITTAIGTFGHKVIDSALALFVTGEPVLNGRIFDLGVFLDHDFHHGGVQLGRVALRGGTALKVGHIRALIRDDQRALKLAGVFRVDAEIGGQFHRATHPRRDVDERAVREHSRVQRGIEVVRLGHDAAQIFLDQFGVLFDRLGDRAEDHTGLFQFGLERGADRHRVKHRIHRDLAAFGGHVLGALNTCKDHLFLERDAQLFIGRQQFGIDLVQRLGLFLHRFRTGIVILVLKIDLGIVDHRPIGFVHRLPALKRLQTPFGHPFGFFVFLRNQAHDIFGQALGGIFHLDFGFPAVLVLAGHRVDGFNRLAIDAFAHFGLFDRFHSRFLPTARGSGACSSVRCFGHAARARNFWCWLSHALANRSMSSRVVSGPRDTRSAPDAAASSKPMARRTALLRTLPEEQADPADTAKPARSICITWVSPFHPGVVK